MDAGLLAGDGQTFAPLNVASEFGLHSWMFRLPQGLQIVGRACKVLQLPLLPISQSDSSYLHAMLTLQGCDKAVSVICILRVPQRQSLLDLTHTEPLPRASDRDYWFSSMEVSILKSKNGTTTNKEKKRDQD